MGSEMCIRDRLQAPDSTRKRNDRLEDYSKPEATCTQQARSHAHPKYTQEHIGISHLYKRWGKNQAQFRPLPIYITKKYCAWNVMCVSLLYCYRCDLIKRGGKITMPASRRLPLCDRLRFSCMQCMKNVVKAAATVGQYFNISYDIPASYIQLVAAGILLLRPINSSTPS